MSGELPAFPVPLNIGEAYKTHAPCDGLTKRELIAAMAMQGMAMRTRSLLDNEVAAESVKLADALLAELVKDRA